MGRWNAVAGTGLAAYDVVDAVLERLRDRGAFPSLREVVLFGHSGGGQLVQRYAIVGKALNLVSAANQVVRCAHHVEADGGAAIDAGASIGVGSFGVRFVVANPSSYLYFDTWRPEPEIALTCLDVNRWKYGTEAPPRYVDGPVASFETRYLRRDVTYLLGEGDCETDHPVLDRSCMAMAQGPHRLARGWKYVAYLRARHGAGMRHALVEVADVGHDGHAMFVSPAGRAVLAGTRNGREAFAPPA